MAEDELRDDPRDVVGAGSKNRIACHLFQTGRCTYGQNCRFRHVLICKRFIKQSWCDEKNCGYVHMNTRAKSPPHQRRDRSRSPPRRQRSHERRDHHDHQPRQNYYASQQTRPKQQHPQYDLRAQYAPTRPQQQPRQQHQPQYAPTSPKYTPTDQCAQTQPRHQLFHHAQTQPQYAPTSPKYTPTDQYAPTSPKYTPTKPKYTPSDAPYDPEEPLIYAPVPVPRQLIH